MPPSFLLLPLLLWACLVGPGLCVTSRLRWRAEERLCAAIGLSVVVVYVAAFAVYAFDLSRTWHVAVSAACGLLSLLSLPAQVRLFRAPAVRHACASYVCLLVWTILLLCLVRNYSGGACAWDWWEHYQRSLVFLEHRPWDPRYGVVPLTARPPLMNVVAAHFLSPLGTGYPLFQVLFTALNLLVVFPLHLSLRFWGRGGARPSALLLGFLMTNPMLLWNATWTWTKLLTAFFVVLGVWFYWAGWRRDDSSRRVAAFVSLAASVLTHFSAAPYALVLAGHYVLFVLSRRRRGLVEAALAAVLAGGLLSTWFVWSASAFGVRETFGANTTVTGMAASSATDNARKVLHNIINTVVPHPLRLSLAAFQSAFSQPSRLGLVRDYLMTLYGTNFFFAMGSVGGLLVLWLAVREFTGAPSRRRGFAVAFVVLTALLGIAVHPTADPFGVAQICGQPLLLLGIAFLAARFTTLPRVAQWLGLLGVALDFGLGVLLEFALENRLFEVTMVNGLPTVGGSSGLSAWALRNWLDKTKWGVVYWGDYFAGAADLIVVFAVAGFLVLFLSLLRIVAAGPTRAEPGTDPGLVTGPSLRRGADRGRGDS